uniref:SCP domain-containing protein n=1 Tax=Strongyloides papillosus TaxID=174720 RepID=A0A0N5BL45_STREA
MIQNDIPTKQFINHDSINAYASENIEIKYVEKRKSNGKRSKTIQKKVVTKKTTKRMTPKKPLGKTTKKPLGNTTKKPLVKKTTTRTSTSRKTQSTRTTPRKITPKTTTTKKPPSRITTSKSTTTSKPVKYKEYIDEIVKEINNIRKYYKTPELEVNSNLAREAQKLADKLLKTKKWEDYKNNTFGVIIYFTPSIEDQYDPIIRWFYGFEKIDYKNLEKTIPPALSQITWVSSKKIGCAISEENPENGALLLCLFSPKGNIPGEYNKNIRIKPNKA